VNNKKVGANRENMQNANTYMGLGQTALPKAPTIFWIS